MTRAREKKDTQDSVLLNYDLPDSEITKLLTGALSTEKIPTDKTLVLVAAYKASATTFANICEFCLQHNKADLLVMPDMLGMTPLHMAVCFRPAAIVRTLLTALGKHASDATKRVNNSGAYPIDFLAQ